MLTKNMEDSEGPLVSALWRRLAVALGAALLLGFLAAVLAGPSARANPGVGAPESPTSCPNQGYNTSTTIANCRPTTTTGSQTFTLTVSYKNGQLKWQACAGTATRGSTVQLYVDGNAVDSRTVAANGCTSSGNTAVCLTAGQHNATATDAQYGLVAQQQFSVQDSGCKKPTVAAATAADASGSTTGSTGSKTSGLLAFTGANIALMVIGAIVLIALGIGTLRIARQRRTA